MQFSVFQRSPEVLKTFKNLVQGYLSLLDYRIAVLVGICTVTTESAYLFPIS